jgi:hypothetical protein
MNHSKPSFSTDILLLQRLAWFNISRRCGILISNSMHWVHPLARGYIPSIYTQGDTRPTGAVPPRLPVSVRRSASLAKCSALRKGDGSQANELRRRCCEGVMFLDWSNVCCSVLLCHYCVQSGKLHVECICGGVANAGSCHSMYQSIIQKINGDFTFLIKRPSIRSYELRKSPSQ